MKQCKQSNISQPFYVDNHHGFATSIIDKNMLIETLLSAHIDHITCL